MGIPGRWGHWGGSRHGLGGEGVWMTRAQIQVTYAKQVVLVQGGMRWGFGVRPRFRSRLWQLLAAWTWESPLSLFCVTDHRIRSDMGLLESCGFYTHSCFYQMIGTDHLCRLSSEKAMGQKEERMSIQDIRLRRPSCGSTHRAWMQPRAWGARMVVLPWPPPPS